MGDLIGRGRASLELKGKGEMLRRDKRMAQKEILCK